MNTALNTARSSCLRLILFCALALFLPLGAQAATYYVPSQYAVIQDAVNAAADGDTIIVADGTYSGSGNRDVTFTKSLTIQSQNGPASTTIDCGGSPSDDGSGDHRAFFSSQAGSFVGITGFTIKNGYEQYGTGGGIYLYECGAAIQNCVFINNTAEYGGGLYVGNRTQSNPIRILGCSFLDNSAVNDFSDGGGAYLDDESYGTISMTDCTFLGNFVGSSSVNRNSGGGVFLVNSSYGAVRLTECTFDGNSAPYGGGVGIDTEGGGGAVSLIGCTLSGNSTGLSSDTAQSTGTVTLTNDILYGDASGEIDAEGNTPPTVSYCDVQGGATGTGNLRTDPKFVRTGTVSTDPNKVYSTVPDLHLQSSSPCLGKGTHTGASATDKDGRTRPSPPSIGAYEAVQTRHVPSQYADIQTAVIAAYSGDTVLIADGTYTGSGNRDIELYGRSVTVQSEHGAAKTILDCGGGGGASHRGFFIHQGEFAMLSGLTIENGYAATSSGSSGNGGGLALLGSGGSLIVSHCTLTADSAENGGGVYAHVQDFAAVTLTQCTLSGDAARGDSALGGGVCFDNADGTLAMTGCTVGSDTSEGIGGGLYNGISNFGSIAVTDCAITGNFAPYGGGGIYSYNDQGTITMTRCAVSGNSAQSAGGVLNSGYGVLTMTNCTVSGNSAQYYGGGLQNFADGGLILLVNDTITANNAYAGGDGGNPAGAGMDNDVAGGQLMLINDIVYGNTGGEIENDSSTLPSVTYCDVQDGYSGTGNIDADPKFVQPPSDLHIQSVSPCLKAGTSYNAPTVDKDGALRPDPPSIGAYEYVAVPPTLSTLSPASATAGGPAFMLTVNGANFVSGSVIKWNGATQTTTFVSSTKLTAPIPASLIASSGTVSITVTTPHVGTSNTLTFTVTAAAASTPVLSSISPTTRKAGGPAFTLTGNGANFVSGSVIKWNGASQTTTFVSSTKLTATIPASLIKTVGTASITITTPHAGTSGSKALTIAP